MLERCLPTLNRSALSVNEFIGHLQTLVKHCPSLTQYDATVANGFKASPMYSSLLPSQPDAPNNSLHLPSRIALAISGGPDSMALTALAKASLGPNRLVGLLVDHNLEYLGVNENIRQTSEWLNQQNIEHEVIRLDWSGDYLSGMTRGKLNELCRHRRYEVLLQACIKRQCHLMLTGHNLEDDLATMLYRSAHLSGLHGLAGMKPVATFPQPHPRAHQFFLGRPFLTVPKARLLATCQEYGIKLHQDPSNDQMDYRRNAVLHSLVQAVKESDTLTTEGLARMLTNVKAARREQHDQLVAVYGKSAIINRLNGDTALVLNDPRWLAKKHLTCRLVNTIIQHSSSARYPPSQASVNRLYAQLKEAYEQHQRDQRQRMARIPGGMASLTTMDRARRVTSFAQRVLGHCTAVALSRNDAFRRIEQQSKHQSRSMDYGPVILFQRAPPPGVQQQSPRLLATTHKMAPNDWLLWDQRFYLRFDPPESTGPDGRVRKDYTPRTFTISYTTMGDVKDFEDATGPNRSLRARLYRYLGITPSTHLYNIPCIREEATNYICFPTLQCDHPPGNYRWRTMHAGESVLADKFLCLP